MSRLSSTPEPPRPSPDDGLPPEPVEVPKPPAPDDGLPSGPAEPEKATPAETETVAAEATATLERFDAPQAPLGFATQSAQGTEVDFDAPQSVGPVASAAP
jgi:hypothetical protein